MPNTLAFMVIGASPLLIVFLFSAFDRSKALILSVIITYLFLPSKTVIDFPGLPGLDKYTLVGITLFLLYLLNFGRNSTHFKESKKSLPKIGIVISLLLIIYIFSPLFTVFANQSPVFNGTFEIRGLSTYDALSGIFQNLSQIAVFLFARKILFDENEHIRIIQYLFYFGIIYCFLIAFEIRMSPQLHTWIYGFFPHDFAQMMRAGGFRPVVFLGHALSATFFLFTAAAAALILTMEKQSTVDKRILIICLVLFVVVLFLSKTLSSISYFLIAAFFILAIPNKFRVLGCFCLAALVISYPILRTQDLIPTNTILNFAESISAARASSLSFRFQNEEMLLEHVREQFLFGWGFFGRNLIYNEWGGVATTFDGTWIVELSAFGMVGFVSLFGLLAAPLFVVIRLGKRLRDVPVATSGIAVIIAVTLLNLLPNSTLSPITWMLCGALLGYAQRELAGGYQAPRGPAVMGMPDNALKTSPEVSVRSRSKL